MQVIGEVWGRRGHFFSLPANEKHLLAVVVACTNERAGTSGGVGLRGVARKSAVGAIGSRRDYYCDDDSREEEEDKDKVRLGRYWVLSAGHCNLQSWW